MSVGDGGTVRVPVELRVWIWPLQLGGVRCGGCGAAVVVRQYTELSELAGAVADHARGCPVPH